MERGGLSDFLMGLGLGMGIGMLFAPRAGAETRDLLRTRADEGKEYLRQRTAGLRDTATEMMDKGREVMNRQRDNLNEAMEAGKQAYRETVGNRPGGEMTR